jgi:hypothetical protein
MGDSGGSVVSVDVERISFGGKVSPSSPTSVSWEPVLSVPLAAIWVLGLGSVRRRIGTLPSDFFGGNLFHFCAVAVAQLFSSSSAVHLGPVSDSTRTTAESIPRRHRRRECSTRIGGSNRKPVSVSPCSGIPHLINKAGRFPSKRIHGVLFLIVPSPRDSACCISSSAEAAAVFG